MDHVRGFRCTVCGREYGVGAPRGVGDVDYVCPLHGDDGILDVLYDYDRIQARTSPKRITASGVGTMWRYKALLPVDADAPVPPLRVGWTPLYTAPRLAESVGLHHMWVKDDGVNPTASFKDRASALAIVKAQEVGATTITTASTGNAAAALAGMTASVALRAVIFVPKSAPQAKIAQHLVYGARVFLVDGTYDDAFELTLEVAREFGWYNRNTAYNPFMTEGKKTAAYEICEQLAWQVPDVIFVPVGDGCILGGIHKGFRDLLALGWIDRLPRLMGVQAEGSASLVTAFEQGLTWDQIRPIEAETVADSICASLPRDRIKALAAVRETDGRFLAVSDAEILGAIPMIAQKAGVFCEPAAAATYAGLAKAVREGWVGPQDRVVLLLTGSGLKDVASAMRTVTTPKVIPASLDAVRAAVARWDEPAHADRAG
ncbi:MAG: threonine synthase [Anaerolineae bacterium]|jgi:threonine synthase|nr:threonine synthase [Anaerolineae bacterium]